MPLRSTREFRPFCDRCGKQYHWKEINDHRKHCNQPEREEREPCQPRTDATCAHHGCSNYADDGDLCSPHAWMERHPGMTYDVYRDHPGSPQYDTERNPDIPPERYRAVYPNYPQARNDERQRRSSNSTGSAQHKPSREQEFGRNERPSWPSGYPEPSADDGPAEDQEQTQAPADARADPQATTHEEQPQQEDPYREQQYEEPGEEGPYSTPWW